MPRDEWRLANQRRYAADAYERQQEREQNDAAAKWLASQEKAIQGRKRRAKRRRRR